MAIEVIRGSESIPARLERPVVTIGNFDGVHLGHRFIFRRLLQEAGREGCPAVVISFDPHPKMVLHPERRPFYLITSLGEKIAQLDALGIDVFLLIPFTLDYARTTADEFVRGVLWDKLRIRKILIGHDYTFGRNREGNGAFLSAAGQRLGFGVEVMKAVCVGDTVISSTKIREALLAGEVGFAATLLGRPYSLTGRVISGSRRGRGLGFPTANILPEKELVPARGVYAVRCLLAGEPRDAVVNIGVNPTFDGARFSVEAHLLDFRGDLYGKTLEVRFIERIRDEVRFPGPQELAAQIGRDVTRARELLAAYRTAGDGSDAEAPRIC